MADLEIPDGFSLAGGAEIPDGFTQAPSYRGSILPFSTDQQGNPRLDWSAGLPGAISSAFMAPGNAASGAMPTPYSGGGATASPENINSAINFATIFGPSSAAARAGEAIPGMLTREVPPTAGQLKAAAGAGYDAARASDLDISGDAVSNMARGLQNGLTADKGIIEKTAPKTWGLLDELANPPQGGFVSVPGLMAAKSGLSNLSLEPGTEGLAARIALGGMRDFMSSLDNSQLAKTATGSAPAQGAGLVPAAQAGAGPAGIAPADVASIIRDADSNYAAAQRSNDLTGALDRANTGIQERAEARAEASHSGRNLDNAIRQRVASFLQNPQNVASFSQPEIDALKGVVAGGPVQNASRYISNMLGGGGGMHGGIVPTVGAIIGGHYGPEGAGLGAAIPAGIGYGLKNLENYLAGRSLNNVDELVRQRSPLYNAMQSRGLLNQPAMGGNNALWRSMLPGMLNQQPAVPGATPGQPIPAGLLANWS